MSHGESMHLKRPLLDLIILLGYSSQCRQCSYMIYDLGNVTECHHRLKITLDWS